MKVNEDMLTHYGILGMKWGIRRNRGSASKKPRSPGSDDYEKARSLKSKKLKDMSNAEIKAFTERLRLEQEYRRLKGAKKNRMAAIIDKIIQTNAEKAISSLISSGIKKGMEYATKRAAG